MYWYASCEGLRVKDMVGLVFGGFAVERRQELFGELEFRHVGFCEAPFFKTLESVRETGEGQVCVCGLGVGGSRARESTSGCGGGVWETGR